MIIRLATLRTGMRCLVLRFWLAARRINGESRRVSVRSISFLTSPQRLQVARADTLLPREKRAFFLRRVAFYLRPHGAVAPSDADVEAAIAAAQRAITQRGETVSR